MPIHLICECGARVIAPSKRAGQSIRCPKCDARLSVPLEEGAAKPAIDSAARKSRLEDAISDLLSARHPASTAPKSEARPAAAPAPAKSPAPSPAPERPSAPRLPLPSTIITAPIVPGPIIAAPISTAPAAISSPVAIAELPTIRIDAPQPLSRPIQIVTSARTSRVDKSWLGAVYGLAMLWSALALVGLAIAGLESYAYYRAEELWRLQRWAFLVIAASTLQLALATYLVQLADWMACRAAAVVIACIAAVEAMILAVTLFSQRDGWFARFLDLSAHLQSGRALGVALLLTLLSILLAYTTASVSLAWQRAEQRAPRPRPAA